MPTATTEHTPTGFRPSLTPDDLLAVRAEADAAIDADRSLDPLSVETDTNLLRQAAKLGARIAVERAMARVVLR